MSPALHTSDASAEVLMGALVDEFLERLGRGERPDVEAYAERYPQLATVLRQMLPALQVMHLSAADPPRTAEAAATALEPEGPLGDFRIVRELGRGGMGVVYEAMQISLGRRVALKVLPFAAALDAEQLQRFKNEAQAAAHLHHPHIVPVYAVGDERGVHYYAMQFIDGHTLAALIEDLRRCKENDECRMTNDERSPNDEARMPNQPCDRPTPSPGDTQLGLRHSSFDLVSSFVIRHSSFCRTAARLAWQAAAALEHAHSLGVVHRDVKPANLLVDGQGNLWVTDFGLARVQTDTRLTLSGDLVGTLRYMSPEQALAQPIGVDHRTDLYSLGATLYEMLTLAPAFAGRDRQELLRQIAFEEPAPPRRLNRAIPAELETIVLKAMAKNPAERYATAQELAEDLDRFLKDEPILAKRPTPVQRARRWARRHRPVVWSVAVAALAVLAVLAGSIGWVVRDRAARQTKRAADLRAALDEARRSQRNGQWPQAQAAAQRAEALLQEGAAEPALAECGQALLRELAEEEADRRLLARLEALRLLQAETDVKESRYLLERAFPDYREAFREYGWRVEALAAEDAAAQLRRRPEAVQAPLLAALDHWLILARHQKALEADWLERVLATADRDVWRQRVRAARWRNDRAALEQLAREVDAAAQPPEALFLLDTSLLQRGATAAAVALLRRAQEAYPGDFWINHDLGLALQKCQPPQYEEALRFLTVAAALRPGSAGVYVNLGRALQRRGQLEAAAAAFHKAIHLKPEYAAAHYNLGWVLSSQGQFDKAAVAFRRVLALRPADAEAYYSLGDALLNLGRIDDAVAAYRQALDRKPAYAEAHCNLGIALQRQGEFAEALAALKKGHELGSRSQDWPYPSGQWVQACQRLLELDGRLPAVLRGEAPPADAAERNEYAQLCFYKKLYVAAARLWAGAFTADPNLADDLRSDYRYNAACAAALAGAGRGGDALLLKDSERVRWRQQALAWLRADLEAYGKLLESSKPEQRRLARQQLRQWQCDQDLGSLRDPAAVAQLPAGEQAACRQLWAEVQTSLAKAGVAR